jgi:hypothetical protein
MERSDIGKLWQRIAADYPQASRYTPIAMQTWLEDLGGYTAPVVEMAYQQHRAGPHGRFAPTSGQLRAIVEPPPTFANARQAIDRAIGAYGSYRPDEFMAMLADVPLSRELVEAMGGVQAVCYGGSDPDHPTDPGVWRSQMEHAFNDLLAAYHSGRLPELRERNQRALRGEGLTPINETMGRML